MSASVGPVVLGIVLSIGGTALLLAVILLFVGLALRVRLRALRERFPETLLFNGYPAADFATGLRMLGAGDGRAGALGFGAVVDHQGITLWQGVSHVIPFATILWSEGATISPSTVTVANGRSSAGLIIRTNVAGRPILLPLQVAKRRLVSFDVAKQPEVAELLEGISKLNRGATSMPVARSAAASTAARRRVELASAWTAARFARIMLVLYTIGTVAATLLALSFTFSGTKRGDPAPSTSQPFFVAMIVLTVLVAATLVGFKRARARETAAGYTTLPGGDINLPYVDPVTGVVLREAGESHLTKDQLKAAVRDRKMAP